MTTTGLEILFDTADLAQVEAGTDIYPLTGITCNPSIIKKEGAVDLLDHLRAIRGIIGAERDLHVQVIAPNADGMLAEARALLDGVDEGVYVKVPVTEEGLRAIKALKADGVRVTATAIYTRLQGTMAIAAGADYLAPYVNRMANLDVDPYAVVAHLAAMADRAGTGSKVLAASFKNAGQVNRALAAGAHAVTAAPEVVRGALESADVTAALAGFTRDWAGTFGRETLL
ncbi:fructose-6-phosphate aldolase [Actinomyces oricola]